MEVEGNLGYRQHGARRTTLGAVRYIDAAISRNRAK